MNVTIEQLLQVIGEHAVQIALLNREVARLTALIPAEPAVAPPLATGPRPVAAPTAPPAPLAMPGQAGQAGQAG